MAMNDPEYLEYLKQFVSGKTNEVPAEFKTYDFVQKLSGYAKKWNVRVDRKDLKLLIEELVNNERSSYRTCYTREEYESGDIPNELSAILKLPDSVEVGFEVFGSRILNFFGIPVVYNKKVVGMASESEDRVDYVLSLDALQANEEYCDLIQVVSRYKGAELMKYPYMGIKNTIQAIIEKIRQYLELNGIGYTEDQLKTAETELVYSIAVRGILCGDRDFRNGNTGIIIDRNRNEFKCMFPNMDFGDFFKSDVSMQKRLKLLEELYMDYPEVFEMFMERMTDLVKKNKDGGNDLYKIIEESFDDDMRKFAYEELLYNIKLIGQKELEICSREKI